VIVPLFASLVTTLFGLALTLTAVFLILLVLVQRGRGGGLAGALGGMGGSSAFGAKAGDIFTRITIGVAAVWILLCIAAAKYSAPTNSRIDVSLDSGISSSANDSATPPQESGSLEGSSLEDKNPKKTEGTTENSGQDDQASTTDSTQQESASSTESSAKTPSEGQSSTSPE